TSSAYFEYASRGRAPAVSRWTEPPLFGEDTEIVYDEGRVSHTSPTLTCVSRETGAVTAPASVSLYARKRSISPAFSASWSDWACELVNDRSSPGASRSQSQTITR